MVEQRRVEALGDALRPEWLSGRARLTQVVTTLTRRLTARFRTLFSAAVRRAGIYCRASPFGRSNKE